MGTTDLQWLTRIVAEQAAALVLYARQWLDRTAAEDAVQDALTALLAEPRPPENPTAWMYRAVRNAAIDYARSASRRRRRERTVAAMGRPWFDAHPETRLDAHAAEAALKTLGAEDREVVVLRVWGDLSFAAIADVTQLAVSTVHDRYSRAIKDLRRELEKPCKTNTN